MNKIIFEYTQGSTTFFSTILDSDYINDNSEVLIYGKHEYGYQRAIKSDHVQGIKKYIRENKDFLFPSSIILAIDEDTYNKQTKEQIENYVYKIDLRNIKFRIVDGQHRLEALKDSNTNISLNVIVIIVRKSNIQIELDVFTNLNSKAKRIPTDLAELAKFKYQLLSEKDSLLKEDSIAYIAMKTTVELNDRSKIWKNAIKVDVNNEINIGIVGISAFKKSIINLVKKLINNMPASTIQELDEISNKCFNLLEESWEECSKKWNLCFNFENEKEPYSTKYYIQKTMGVSVINVLISDYLDSSNTIIKFKEMIKASEVKISDWETAGIMYGNSSEAGFNKIRKFIKNESRL